ncbi:hypothetical protein [Paenirhodobacter sp.]|uniref:hypothetical protein n=1 Tax=Paenirhodobacter sp. TaxID=1965326 RepID=UPI003B3FFC3D
MDRISGILPQIGWSPAMAPVTAEKPPATTVEAVAASSSVESGLGADVDTQTENDRAAWISAQLRKSGKSAESTVLAKVQEDIDPNEPVGPPPTFEISPLEAKAAELRKPEPVVAKDKSSVIPAAAGVEEQEDFAKQNVSQLQPDESRTAGNPQTEWQTLDTVAPGQSLDLLR